MLPAPGHKSIDAIPPLPYAKNMYEPMGPVDVAAEIIGDKWIPQILRMFFDLGIVRFRHLEELGINPRTLSFKLQLLEELEIIQKTMPLPNSHCEYSLTQKGLSLYPIMLEMSKWSRVHRHSVL